MDANHVLEAFVGAVIAILVGVELAAPVFNSVVGVTGNTTYKSNANLTGALALLNILPLIFGVIILVGAISFVVLHQSKNA